MVMLQTERLTLYALSRAQLNLALTDINRLAEQLQIVIAAEVFSEESRQAMVIKMSRMDHADAHQHEWYTYFLLVQSAERCAVGVCGFKGAPTLFGSVELGYAMHEAYRNLGYMTEAVQAMVAWAFTHESCRVITAETLRGNFPSQHVLQKAGLRLDRSAETMLYWKIDRAAASGQVTNMTA